MKIAVTSTGDSLQSFIDERFGRCKYFLIVDSDTMDFETIVNTGGQIQSGAGPKAAALILDKGAEVLLSGHVGDKAEEALKKGGIKIVGGFHNSIKVKDAVNTFLHQV
jgi:predicted Fe-Mo cluster-binding NifX family protein